MGNLIVKFQNNKTSYSINITAAKTITYQKKIGTQDTPLFTFNNCNTTYEAKSQDMYNKICNALNELQNIDKKPGISDKDFDIASRQGDDGMWSPYHDPQGPTNIWGGSYTEDHTKQWSRKNKDESVFYIQED